MGVTVALIFCQPLPSPTSSTDPARRFSPALTTVAERNGCCQSVPLKVSYVAPRQRRPLPSLTVAVNTVLPLVCQKSLSIWVGVNREFGPFAAPDTPPSRRLTS